MATDKTSRQRLGRQLARERAIIDSGGIRSASQIIRPEGRAPRGMGQEYADRRRIASTIDRLNNYKQQNQAYLDRYRGQRNQQQRATIARERVNQLSRVTDDMVRIALGGGDWAFKREMVDGLAQYAEGSLLTGRR